MIEPRELRIGNLVWNDTQKIPCTVNVKVISEQFYRYEIFLKTGKDRGLWKPIPLTEEWFIKFGFEKLETYVYSKKIDSFATILVDYEDGSVAIFDYEKNYELGNYPAFGSFCKYVHQLQNLNHSLTGKELTLKEGTK